MKYLICICIFAFYTAFIYTSGKIEGEKNTKTEIIEKEVVIYREREENTIEHEKKVEEIKEDILDLGGKNEECDFVLNYDVSSCLH